VTLVTGGHYVLVARVPRASDRWAQVGFNAEVAHKFFRVTPGQHATVRLERISCQGSSIGAEERRLVYSKSNRNHRLEFDFSPVVAYPSEGPPILAVLEVAVRTFRYIDLMPRAAGYDEMFRLTEELPTVGRGLRRALTTLDEVELRWPGCPLRPAS
jgi:hypothetical protein